MQTYFTELPSPSLKHRAHKYTSKKFVNGKWQYFYDVITGRSKYRKQYNTAAETKENLSRDTKLKDAQGKARVAKANLVRANVKLANAKRNLNNANRYIEAKKAGYNTEGISIDKQYAKELGAKELNSATKSYNNALREEAGKKRARESMIRAEDAKMAAAKRKYEQTVPQRLKRTAKNISGNVKNNIAEAFKKASSSAKKLKNDLKVTHKTEIGSYDNYKVSYKKASDGTVKKITTTSGYRPSNTKDLANKLRVDSAQKAYGNSTTQWEQKKKKKSK